MPRLEIFAAVTGAIAGKPAPTGSSGLTHNALTPEYLWEMVDQMPEAKALFVREALGLIGDLPALAKA
ncbi:hypothetical protein LOY38_01570 [Pseudomonas sp. B21-015]|nr:hypothetical protein [Pseudomonas sp. B21-015]UVM50789.1 hypothetical protein LOY38_01570 [Pseudomonas sp. B21-015]